MAPALSTSSRQRLFVGSDLGVRQAQLACGTAEPAEALRSCLPALVLLRDHLGQLLPVVQGIVDALLTGDDPRDVLTDLGPKVGELRNVDELNTDCWARLDTWIDRVSSLDRL